MKRKSEGIGKLTLLALTGLLIVGQALGAFPLGQDVAKANPEDAVPIEFGETLSGSIAVVGEMDAYVFSANASDVALIRVSPTLPTFPMGINLYFPNGTKLKGATGWGYLAVSSVLPVDGEYKILVYALLSYTGSYRVYLQRLNNPVNAVPIGFGETLSGSIAVAGEMDAYVFSANASDVAFVRVSATTTPVGIILYFPNGTHLKGALGSGYLAVSSVLPVDGEYKILVYNTYPITGSYSVYLQRLNNPVNAIPIEFGETLSGSIAVAGEMDAYVFSANASDVVSVKVSATAMLMGIILYFPNGTQFKQDLEWNTVEVSSVLPVDGEYKILVYNTYPITGSYSTSVVPEFPSAIILTLFMILSLITVVSVKLKKKKQ